MKTPQYDTKEISGRWYITRDGRQYIDFGIDKAGEIRALRYLDKLKQRRQRGG